MAADDAWEVFVGGQPWTPVNGSSENDWRFPARYETVVQGTGSTLVIGIHVRDVAGVQSGLLAHVRAERINPPTTLSIQQSSTGSTGGWYSFQPSSSGAQPPADWHTTSYLPYADATKDDWALATSASACAAGWGGNVGFLNAWTVASGGAAPTEWVWENGCEAGTKGWRKENWYRVEIDLDYCPAETPPPLPCCTWKISSHGALDGLWDTPPTEECVVDADDVPPSAFCIDRIGCGWNEQLCRYRCGADFWQWECV